MAYMLHDSGAVLVLTETRLRGQFETDSLDVKILCVDADWEPLSGQ
jgi:hypothetical protein